MSDPAADFIDDEWGDTMKRSPREEAILGSGYAAGRLAVLREVREMVDRYERKYSKSRDLNYEGRRNMAYFILQDIDALIKREEEGR